MPWSRVCLARRSRKLVLAVMLAFVCAACAAADKGVLDNGAAAVSFPRLMGMNIGAKNYQDPVYQQELARLDVVILGFHRGWQPAGYAASATAAIRKAVRAIKARNPKILVGQYTILNETYGDPADSATQDLRDKLDASGWWLRNAAGRKVQWTAEYAAWEVNFTSGAKPDAEGRRWPGWLARMGDARLIRSMSRKGCSPDNAACEGFFGRLKTELFYPRKWSATTIEQFIQVLDSYIRWYNEKRIKISLGSLSPFEYRESLGIAA